MIDVSIVIPTLNEEKYLEKTLQSIKDQKFKGKYEIIISDSNSKDKTREIAKGFKAIIVDAGMGIATGRQEGCKKAKGKIIVSAGADVIYEQNWLEELTKEIRNENAVACCGRIKPLDGTKIEDIFADFILHPIADISYKIRIPFAVADNIAVRKDIFKKVGGWNTKLTTGEDTDLIKKIMKFGKIHYAENAVANVSMRRVRDWGYGKYLSFHTKNFIKCHTNKEPEQEYDPVR